MHKKTFIKTDRAPKILHVLNGLGAGGAETWLMEVLRFCAGRGIATMDFLLTGGESSLFDAEAASLDSKLYYLRYGRAHLAKFFPAYRRSGKYDVIHDHSDYVSGWGVLLGLGFRWRRASRMFTIRGFTSMRIMRSRHLGGS